MFGHKRGYTRAYGGSGGGVFDDGYPAAVRSTDIYYQGHSIRAIRMKYAAQTGCEYYGACHGHAQGTHYQANLQVGELIIAVVGRYTSTRKTAKGQQLFLTLVVMALPLVVLSWLHFMLFLQYIQHLV